MDSSKTSCMIAKCWLSQDRRCNYWMKVKQELRSSCVDRFISVVTETIKIIKK